VEEDDEINIDEDIKDEDELDQDRKTEDRKKTTSSEVKEVTSTEVKAMREYLCNKCPRDSRLFFLFEK